MISKRRKWVIALAIAVVVGVLTALLLPFAYREGPIYKGRHLSKWVEVLGYDNPPSAEYFDAWDAIQATGTNACPLLLKWLPHEESHWRYALSPSFKGQSRHSHWVELIVTSPAEARAVGAMTVLRKSTNTSSADVEQLTRLMSSPAAPYTALRAAQILASIGPAGYPALVPKLEGPPSSIRQLVVANLLFQQNLATPAHILVPGLIKCAHDTNTPNIDWMAVQVLAKVGEPSPLIVSALTGVLDHPKGETRYVAAMALGNCGSNALLAVPALSHRLNDPEDFVRDAATNALRQIASEALTNAPAK